MSLRLKAGVELEELRKYGFKTGKEWAEAGEPCMAGVGYEYQHKWYHKYMMDGNRVYYTEDDIPMVEFTVKDTGEVYIDCAPDCTYHIGGSELDVVTDTLYELITAGLLEVTHE